MQTDRQAGRQGGKGQRETYREIESRHQQHQINQNEPMSPQRNFALREKSPRDTSLDMRTSFLTLSKGARLREKQSERNNQHRHRSPKPVKRPPALRRGPNQSTRKRRRKQIPKRIALLQQTRDDAARLSRTIFQRGGGSIPVQPAHGNPKQRTTCQELRIRLGESRAQFQGDKQDIVDNKRPFAAPSICRDPEYHRAHGPQHQNQCNSPGDVRHGLVELCR